MTTVQVRENRQGDWWCNTTFNGYDHSVTGSTPEDAKEKILRHLNITESDVIFEEIQPYPSPSKTFIIK